MQTEKMYLDMIKDYVSQAMRNSSADAPVWNIEKIKDGKPAVWNYIDGCMITALLNLYKQTGGKEYLDFSDYYIDYYIHDDGQIRGFKCEDYNLDNLCGGRVLFDLYAFTGKEKYKKAINTLYGQIVSHPRTKEGNFWHKKIYPNQVWLDGLFMAQVFYTRYCVQNEKDFADIIAQFASVDRIMYDGVKKLYYHGYDESKTAFWCDDKGLSSSFWLRSMGWLVMALADCLEYLPKEAQNERHSLGEIFKKAAQGLSEYIDKSTGMLYQVIDKAGESGNYAETSGSAMVAYAFMKGARLGVLPADFAGLGKDIFFSICKKHLIKSADGTLNLGGICLVAGLGPETNRRRDGTYEYYVSEPIVSNDAKGIAPLLLAYTEVMF